MKIPRYWASAEKEITTRDGNQLSATKWYWSDESEDQARLLAKDRLETMLSRLHAGERWPERRAYDYGENSPLREERLRDVQLPDGHAIITRNAYGALILNVENVMFVDIDLAHDDRSASAAGRHTRAFADQPEMFSFQWFVNLIMEKVFGTPPASSRLQAAAPPSAPSAPQSYPALEAADRWAAQHPGTVFRAYQTKSGYRLIAMHDTFAPDAPETLRILQELGCDPVYIRLCKNQQSFRARLTPKPWRVSAFQTTPPARFPYPAAMLNQMQKWIAAYDNASAAYATCRYIKTIGNGTTNPTAQAVANLHDEISRAETSLPLA